MPQKMLVDIPIERVPLSKQRLLEFLGAQNGPITAKVASIGLDTRASTATEMLERCAAQGLVERNANQRPREYTITAAGRQALGLIVPSEADSERESADMEANAIRESSKKVRALLERLRKLQGPEAEREDMPASAGVAKAETNAEVIRSLYCARYELRSLGLTHARTAAPSKPQARQL
jgi:DNA-binding MarR family transcriptional regulator